MNIVFTAEGWRALRAPWLLLLTCIVLAIAMVAGSYWFVERERRERVDAGRKIQEARSRLDVARRERDSLRESSETFESLRQRGLLRAERRLDLIELVNDLRARHELYAVDYEISPQRRLNLPAGRDYPSVDVLASRVRVRASALHEGDALAFIGALSQSQLGFYPVERCTLRRMGTTSPEALESRVEAECMLEWITLKEKNAPRA